jgi:tyrosine-protein kinase Etk/Wzc
MANDVNAEDSSVVNFASSQTGIANMQSEEAGFLDFLLILTSRKLTIFICVFLGCLMATVIAFLTPPTYTAMAVILPPPQQSSTAAAVLGQLGGMASLAGQSLGIKNASDPYMGILGSRTVADEIISQFSLKDIYKVNSLTDARNALSGATHITSTKYSLIQISVEDRDPKRAAVLANAYVDKLQVQNSRLAVTESSQRRLFFESQLEAAKDHLARAEGELRTTQEQKGIVQVNSQVAAVIGALAQMRAEIAAREVNLQRLKTGATPQNPEVLRQEIELQTLREKLRELETARSGKSGDPFLPTNMVPAAGLEYARRLREVKYRESLYELLAKQYEAARIDEAKESPIIQIVDRAVPSDRKTAPRRSMYLLVGLFLGGIIGVFLALVSHAIHNSRNAAKYAALKKLLWVK